jgi:hypothetical protein
MWCGRAWEKYNKLAVRLTRPGVATCFHFQQEQEEGERMATRKIKNVWQPSVDYHSTQLEDPPP